MGCIKKKIGKEYEENRKIQKIIEKSFEVEPDVALICLGNMNGRWRALEPPGEPGEHRCQWKNDRRMDPKL